MVFSDLLDSGFVPNQDKSTWYPVQDLIFLGIGANMKEGVLYIPAEKLANIKKQITKVLHSRGVTARMLASVAGKITSLNLVVGNVTNLMTKYSHFAICARERWDSYFSLSDDVKQELNFWLSNLDSLKVKPLKDVTVTSRIVYSDASSVACGGYTVGVRDSVVHRAWTLEESKKSSAWRELVGVFTVLTSVIHLLKGQNVKWFTDNQAVVRIIEKGSMKADLQYYALQIYRICVLNNIRLEMQWVPRGQNERADYISKYVDTDDWGVTQSFFRKLDLQWGPHDIDRFANSQNTKLIRFNSRMWCPGSEGLDAFSFNWKGQNNWLVPPVYLVPRVIKHLKLCGGEGTLVVPLWKSAAFWPLLVDSKGVYNSFIVDNIIFHKANDIFVQGSIKSIFDNSFKSPVVALRIKF